MAEMHWADQRVREVLQRYLDIPAEQEDALLQRLQWHTVQGGAWLFHQGEAGDALYLLVRGQLQVWLERDAHGLAQPPRLIGRVTPGDSVGELALLTGQPRTAGIRAVRDSQLLRISRATFDALAGSYPDLVMRLAGRVAALVAGPVAHARGATQNLKAVALLPLDEDDRSVAFIQQLVAALQAHGTTRRLDHSFYSEQLAADASATSAALVSAVQQAEDDHHLLVFQCDPCDSEWTRFALRQSDLIVSIAQAAKSPVIRPWERSLGLTDAGSALRRSLVLLRGPAADAIEGTGAWLSARQPDFHLQVRSDRSDDIARVARVIAGKAIGLVLGSGACRGFAHLGVYQALCEAGIPVDWLGGTSIGAVMAAAVASDLPPDRCIALTRKAFVQGKPFSDYTLPLVALLSGGRMRRLIRSQMNHPIEDLALPFFCLSANLGDGSANLHRNGSLAQALEATVSMPGILPPTVVDGHLAIDGSVLNSLPVNLMWQQPVGQVIAVDLASKRSREIDYAQVPSAWTLLRSRLLPGARKYRVPALMTLMLKATELATLQNIQAQGTQANLLLQPDVRRFGLTQVKAFDRIVEAGYHCAVEQLKNWRPDRT